MLRQQAAQMDLSTHCHEQWEPAIGSGRLQCALCNLATWMARSLTFTHPSTTSGFFAELQSLFPQRNPMSREFRY
jgi:hypothetical protein